MTTKKKRPATAKSTTKNTVTLGRLLMGREQWARFAKIPKSPKIAHKIATFIRSVLEYNLDLIEKQKNEYITQFSTSTEGEAPEIDGKKHPDSLRQFNEAFSQYLETEIEVDCIDVTMDELIDAMENNQGCTVDELVLLEVETFFRKSR